MKIDQKELRERIKSEKATLRDLRGQLNQTSKAFSQLDRKVRSQEKLVARLESKKK